MKLYTLEEARLLLPQVIPVVEALRDAIIELRAVQASVAAHTRGASGDGHLMVDPWSEKGENRVEDLNRTVQRAAAQLDRWEIEVKDPEKGLIDFFHERQARTVYLCYLLGEEQLAFWHELDAGFAGRQPI
jgi:hypothetical protein